MNYGKIGQQIRKHRKAQGLSQEQLAERIGISVTHMSHIETGSTKLSLPVLADIADVLEVSADDLLNRQATARSGDWAELAEILETCTPEQVRILTDVARAVKASLEAHMG